MTTEQLEQLLEARAESPSLDFKSGCSWSVEAFAKDLLAMTNSSGGGRLVIGVDDGTFERKGVTPEQRDSYVLDIMRDQMTRYADPHVLFESEPVKDKTGLEYVVIQVRPFQEVPVICRITHEGAKVRKAAIYYRGSHRRPESAEVDNSFDMRTITLRAAALTGTRMKELGYVVKTADSTQFDEELKDL